MYRCESWTIKKAAAATAAKSLQWCPTLCKPIDGSPPGLPSLGFSRQEHWSGLPFPSPMHEVSDSSDPMDCSLPGSSVHGIFQAKVLEWGAIAFSNKEGRVQKYWYFQTVVLKKTLESPLDSTEIKPVNPKRNQPWIFTGRTGAEAETPILWPPDVKSRLTGKDLDARKDWMARGEWGDRGWKTGWHPWLSRLESEQNQGDSEGQGCQACYSPWGCKESDTT